MLETTSSVLRSLRGALQAANRIVPFIVVVALLLATVAIAVAATSSNAMMAIAVLLVLGTSIVVYASTSNYGEAALALVAGLLTVFSVEWTAGRFVIFAGAWTVFSLAVLLIASIRIAATVEDLYLHAASSVSRNSKTRSGSRPNFDASVVWMAGEP